MLYKKYDCCVQNEVTSQIKNEIHKTATVDGWIRAFTIQLCGFIWYLRQIAI